MHARTIPRSVHLNQFLYPARRQDHKERRALQDLAASSRGTHSDLSGERRLSIPTMEPEGEKYPRDRAIAREGAPAGRVAEPSRGGMTLQQDSTPNRSSLESRLFQEGYLFDFFQAVRVLQRLGRRVPVGYAGPPKAEAVRFRAHISLSFPPSSIHELIRPDPDHPAPTMVEAFMGLTGPNGILPRHYTELLYRLERERSERNPEKHALRDWFDLFNHRLVSLFYRAWEKYRFFVPYERGGFSRPEPDLFTSALYSLVGLGAAPLRNRLRVAVRKPAGDGDFQEMVLGKIENLVFLRYSGLLANQLRSAAGLQAILQDYFGLPVRVDQFVGQ